ncbi:MAG: Vitamin K epoxide reductase [candidate division WS6 bacterium GW2011_GWF2_39_15]|uniref:Vitamin K epoxide reductase n=1 Tax=candidate division WS6 bacterium GW2011_GWF2_39_15 TaxID=1619100 RepID=A0A0G0Q5Q6_9BACT|nr:MAG: Vitamin K epoxide reductase [candidate division WS6 bacterium GW2011_GWF2_39_15]
MSKGGILKILLLLFSLGVLISSYLYISKVVNAPVICPDTGCQVIADSPYSYFIGQPVALWGLMYFLGMFVITVLLIKKELHLLKSLYYVGVIVGVLFTLYLRYVEFFKVGAICVWCWASVVVMIGIIVFTLKMYSADRTK